MPILLVINDGHPIEEKHICFFTKPAADNKIALCEVVEAFYKHPDAPDYALVPVIEIRHRGTANRGHHTAASMEMMEIAQKLKF